MTEKVKVNTHTNNFKFVLYQGENIVVEKIFNADVFNPIIRYSVDIREFIPTIIQNLQKVMSRRNLNYKDIKYNFVNYDKDLIDFYRVDNNKLSKPNFIKYNYGNKTIKGVECKFGLYINNNPIVERKFYVDNYNPVSRFSTEIINTVDEIVEDIHLFLKDLDVNHMWNDYTLINTYGLYVNQIRELSKNRRKEMIEKSGDRTYIKKVKSYYRSQSQSYHQQVPSN